MVPRSTSDSGNVQQLRVGLRETAKRARLERGFIEIDPGRRRLDEADPADPADHVLRIAEASRRKGDARHRIRNSGKVLRVELAERFGWQNGDARRNIPKRLRPLQCGYNNITTPQSVIPRFDDCGPRFCGRWSFISG